ncbi:DUF3299 domain-containing protein [Neptunomonas antarctica]|uniref:DUF3299 domain-containing protein n=1 Tax=Neptunomonas antarctica TaxID=619304 RepID=A0A1N7NI41_9GAMM|nr:DUF3299 domain-containing protein [Neptunomonas antarctica]SIS97918.1 hypothetical protein SAMN05421760_109149 [Neptunomonas antarctica]
MQTLRSLFILFTLSVLWVTTYVHAGNQKLNGETIEQIEWEQLMPADYSLDGLFEGRDLGALDDLDPKSALLMDELQQALQSAPVVPEMNGKMIRIPGFVVPVEGEDQNVYKFFLVPYFGACIHVPPPPSNQIIYAHYEPGVKVESLYDAIWITGKLKTETFSHELASSGYSIEVFRIEPYDE